MSEDAKEPAGERSTGERAGDVICRYKLLQEIGVGGMGSVWEAVESEPLKRKVALTDHAHIANVIDGGAITVWLTESCPKLGND